MAILRDMLALMCAISSICWPLTLWFGCDVAPTSGRSVLELAVLDGVHPLTLRRKSMETSLQCQDELIVQCQVNTYIQVMPRWDSITHPESLEDRLASLMSTNLWQRLSEHTVVFDVICLQHPHVIQLLFFHEATSVATLIHLVLQHVERLTRGLKGSVHLQKTVYFMSMQKVRFQFWLQITEAFFLQVIYN